MQVNNFFPKIPFLSDFFSWKVDARVRLGHDWWFSFCAFHFVVFKLNLIGIVSWLKRFWKGLPYRYALSLQVTPSLIHLLQPLMEEVGVLLSVQATDQLLAGAVEAEVHVPVLLHLILQVLEIKNLILNIVIVGEMITHYIILN